MKNKQEYGDWFKANRNYALTFRLKSTKEQKQWMQEHLEVGQALTIKKDEDQQRIDVFVQGTLIGEVPARIYEQIHKTQRFVRNFEVSNIVLKGMVGVEAAEVVWTCAPEVKNTLETIKLVPVEIKKSNTVWLTIDVLAIVFATILVIFNLGEPGQTLWLTVGLLVVSLISFGVHINERGK